MTLQCNLIRDACCIGNVGCLLLRSERSHAFLMHTQGNSICLQRCCAQGTGNARPELHMACQSSSSSKSCNGLLVKATSNLRLQLCGAA